MLFNSIHFLIFFPIVVLVYFIIPKKVQWVWLLVCSYYFYMSWNAKYAILIAFSTVVTYLGGIFIGKLRKQPETKKRDILMKWGVALSFGLNLIILFFFKYFNFFSGATQSIFAFLNISINVPVFDVLLPVGISFYTFQALSYTVDVYRGKLAYEKRLGRYALYVSFFPQLVAGPIERSGNLLHQINQTHKLDFDRLFSGLRLMIWGFFEKIVIADRVAIVVNQVYQNYDSADYNGLVMIFATVLFAVQIYCDFSAYSDIAIGAARILGIDLMQNFARPYFATSIRNFWKRWHISLSTWFRDYLYIPLGGSRCSKPRQYCNTMVTFLVSGLWHGANWTFIIWGGLHGFFQIAGDALKPARKKLVDLLHIKKDAFSYRLLQMVFTFVLVVFAWIFFRADSLTAAFHIVKKCLFSFDLNPFFNGTFYNLGLTRGELEFSLLSIGVLFCVSLIREKQLISPLIARQNTYFRWLIYIVPIFAILFMIIHTADVVGQEFIYFQF